MSPEQVALLREKMTKVATESLEERISRLRWHKHVNDMLFNSLVAGGLLGTAGYYLNQRHAGEAVPAFSAKKVELPVLAEPAREAEKVKQANFNWWEYFPGLRNTNTLDPAATPGAVLASYAVPSAAAYAAWRAGSAIANKQRRVASKEDLRKAKAEYDKELNKLFPPEKPKEEKAASELGVDAMLEQIFEKMAVTNENPILAMLDNLPVSSDLSAKLLSGYSLYALPAAIGGYHLIDTAMQGQNKNTLLQKAIEERERRRAAARPAPLQITLAPKRVTDDDELK